MKFWKEGTDQFYDASSVEIEEIRFVIKHAERFGAIDYYPLIRKLYTVRKRVVEAGYGSTASSPNLNSLTEFLMKRYDNGPEGN